MAEKFTVDGDAVRALAKLLEETHLNEVEYQVGTHRIKVQRSPDVAAFPVAAPVHQPVASTPAAPIPQPAEPPQAATPAPIAGEAIKSPMVGTAYLCPEPGAKPFISPGDTVNEGDTLLIVEAMKVMNPIKAPRSGKIAEVVVSDSAPVEFGETLIIIQ